ncbi:hypothetical protein D0T57_07605 [Dysgonomonas sp. 511]|nr:hypothetical protein [Dysgonomonas sp. 511]
MSFASCVNNEDEPGATPPDPPLKPTDLKEDELLGTWETYYMSKEIQAQYYAGANPDTYPSFRLIEYDGYKTSYFYDSEREEYRFTTKNVIDSIIEDGTYSTKGNCITYDWKSKWTGEDTTTYQWIGEIGHTPGILKRYIEYSNVKNEYFPNAKFFVRDFFLERETSIAPNSVVDINPEKEMVDFDYLLGNWEITGFTQWIGVDTSEEFNKKQSEILKGTLFTFRRNEKNEPSCTIGGYDEYGKWVESENLIEIVDDVIYFIYDEKVVVPNTDPDAEKEFYLVKESFNFRVTHKANNTFRDLKTYRDLRDLSKVVKEEIYIQRK